MKNHKTLANLEEVLANSYALMLKTHNYHWNVFGENFKSLHELFGAQYEELFAAVDEIAERIRTIGFKVDGSFENFLKLTKFQKGDKDFVAGKMIDDLISDNEALVGDLKQGVKTAQSEEDEATADIFIGRIQIHEKAIWMLQSSR